MVTDAQILEGFYNSSAPQDWEQDVKPVEDELKKLDRNIRIIWNPKAFVTRPGHYDVSGKAVPPEYQPMYQLTIPGKSDGVMTIVHTVGTEDALNKHYKPIGMWLVEFMRLWDSANVHRMNELRRLQDEEFAIKEALAISESERRKENTARFASDVLGFKPIMSVIPTQIR